MSGNLIKFKLEKLDLNTQQKYPTAKLILPKTNSLPLKIIGRKMTFHFGACLIFRVFALSFFREGTRWWNVGILFENEPLEDVFPIENEDISLIYACLPEGSHWSSPSFH